MKKTIAFLLVAVMALSMTSAFAGSPVSYVEPVTVDTPALAPAAPVAAEEVAAEKLTVVVGETEEVAEALAAIEKVVEAGAPVITYFPDDTQAKVKDALPEAVEAGDLELNEFVALTVENAEQAAAELDEVRLVIAFTTKYDPAQKVFPLIGLVDANGNVNWILVEGEVQADGSVMLIIPADVLEKMGNAASVQVAVLSTPKA